jgi:hypothetical protein
VRRLMWPSYVVSCVSAFIIPILAPVMYQEGDVVGEIAKLTFAVIALVLLVYLVLSLSGSRLRSVGARGLQPARCKTVLPDSYGVAVLMRARFRDPENG